MLLALETANDQCSVVIFDDQHQTQHENPVLAREFDGQRREQTRLILPMIDAVLKKCRLQLSDLTAIAFSQGPGSFSGIRINTAVAQALAWANDLPVIGVSSLQATAQQAYTSSGMTFVSVILDARMNEVYTADFYLNKALNIMMPVDGARGIERLVSYDAVLDFTLDADQTPSDLIGSGVQLITPYLVNKNKSYFLYPDVACDASDIAEIASEKFKLGEVVTPEQALPVYLRDDAWKKLDAQREYTSQKLAQKQAEKDK